MGIAAVAAVIQREKISCRGIWISSCNMHCSRIVSIISHCVEAMAVQAAQKKQKRERRGLQQVAAKGSSSEGKRQETVQQHLSGTESERVRVCTCMARGDNDQDRCSGRDFFMTDRQTDRQPIMKKSETRCARQHPEVTKGSTARLQT